MLPLFLMPLPLLMPPPFLMPLPLLMSLPLLLLMSLPLPLLISLPYSKLFVEYIFTNAYSVCNVYFGNAFLKEISSLKFFDMNVIGSSTTIFLKSLLWQLATIGLLFHCRILDEGEFEVIEGSSGKMVYRTSLIRLVKLPRKDRCFARSGWYIFFRKILDSVRTFCEVLGMNF